MSIKLNVISAIMTAGGIMAVDGCGYSFSRDGQSEQDASTAETDIAVMKDTAMSSLATNKCIVSVGNGRSAELTIDLSLQRLVSEVLTRHADTNDTGVGWATLISIEDGAVLALADCGGDADAPRPFALRKVFEPGHLLSTLTVAAAIDADIATPNTELFTSSSEAYFADYKLPSDGGHVWGATLTVSNALTYSSNVVLAKLGILVGRDKEYEILNKFGIGIRSGIGFADEKRGRMLPPDRWCRMLRTRVPIGQGVETTAIQIARAYATLANHGERVDSYAVKKLVDATGKALYEHVASTNKVQVVSRKAADSACAILEGAVKADDTKKFTGLKVENPPDIAQSLVQRRAPGRRAAVDGVPIAGKTSTVYRMKPSSYEYDFQRYTASFAGFFPADAPKYVLVVCYETKRADGVPFIHQGGGRPAMAFAEVVKRMGYGKQMNCKQ